MALRSFDEAHIYLHRFHLRTNLQIKEIEKKNKNIKYSFNRPLFTAECDGAVYLTRVDNFL